MESVVSATAVCVFRIISNLCVNSSKPESIIFLAANRAFWTALSSTSRSKMMRGHNVWHIAVPEERVSKVHLVWCKSYPQVGPGHRQIRLQDRLSQTDGDHPRCKTPRAQRSRQRRLKRSVFLGQKIRTRPRMWHVLIRVSRKQAQKRSAGRPCQARPGSCTHGMDKFGWWNSRASHQVYPIQIPLRRSHFFEEKPFQRLGI